MPHMSILQCNKPNADFSLFELHTFPSVFVCVCVGYAVQYSSFHTKCWTCTKPPFCSIYATFLFSESVCLRRPILYSIWITKHISQTQIRNANTQKAVAFHPPFRNSVNIGKHGIYVYVYIVAGMNRWLVLHVLIPFNSVSSVSNVNFFILNGMCKVECASRVTNTPFLLPRRSLVFDIFNFLLTTIYASCQLRS